MFESTPKLYTNKFLKTAAKAVHEQIREIFGNIVHKSFFPFIEAFFWAVALVLIDFILQKIFGWLFGLMAKYSKVNWIKKFYEHKVFRSLVHFIPLNILINLDPYVFQKYVGIDKFADKFIDLIIILLILRLIFRVIDSIIAINDDYTTHTTVGIRTFGQMLKIFAAFFGIITFIATLIDVEITQILTILGALTAVVFLVFRDSILGFVSGLQISSSKSIKVGDWISVSKYDIEGIVREINLTVTKIEKFDKTVSTVPTYDLIASEVTNHSWMTASNTRRIKRSMIFNVDSFRFCDDELLTKFEKIDLITDYIQSKKSEIVNANKEVKNPDLVINGRQLTNIGVFRVYVNNYLKNRPDISKVDKIIVRQLELTSAGMPLEIYCFANNAHLSEYEQIQSDLFDHLISACKEFELEISQPFIIQQNGDQA